MRQRVSSPAFAGRAGELELLGATLGRASAGSAAMVLVGGDAGIGKSRLVEELCARARREGALIARGGCVPLDGASLPYGPVVGFLRDLVRQSAGGVPATLLDPLGLGESGFASGAPPRLVADELAKTKLFAAVLSCLATLAEGSTVVIVVEDLQWADSASAELLGFITRNLVDSAVLVVCTYRSDELGRDHRLRPWLSELTRHPRVTTIALDGLARDEMAVMVEGIFGQPPDRSTVDSVWARSQGNPFFAEELAAAGDGPLVSPEFRSVILGRVEGRSPEAAQVLRAVAAAGVAVEHDVLVALDVLDAAALDGALAETIDAQLLVVDPSRSGYQFRHELLREAVYEATLPGERRGLHRRLAVALATGAHLGPDGPGHRAAELAAHWWAAGEWAHAVGASREAADAASAVWAFPEALVHIERALSALDRQPAASRPAADRLELLERASDVAYLAGAGSRSVELARQAIDGLDASAAPGTLASAHLLLGRNAWAIGDGASAFDAYRRARALVPVAPASVELARILAEEARGLMLVSRFAEAEERARDALATATAVGDRTVEGHALCTLACCRGAAGHFDEGIALGREALAIAEDRADPEALDRAYGNLSHVLMESGRLAECVALVFDNIAAGEELWGARLNGATANGVESLIRLGRFDEAAGLLGETSERAAGSCTMARPLLRAMVAIRRGRFDEANDLLGRSEELTATFTDVQRRAAFHLLAAELALLEGRAGDAYRDVERALALAAGTDDETFRPEMWALAARCLADDVEDGRARGRRIDVDKARLLALGFEHEAMALVVAPAVRGGTCPPRTAAFAATCAAERSRLDESDPERWAEAARRWDAAGEPYPMAYCRWREAEARLERREGRARAEECLQESWLLAAGLGAVPLEERIARLAQRARVALHDTEAATGGPTVADDLGLTPREVEVLGQLAGGRTDREIADLLFISKKTVSVHVSNLLRKLDVTNRVEAGRIGQAHGCG